MIISAGGEVGDQRPRVGPVVGRRRAPPRRLVGAHDDPVGVQEVVDRAALAQELRIRGVGDAGQAALVERAPQPGARAGRDRGLHDQHGVGRAGWDRLEHRLDAAQIGVAGRARRRVHAHERDVRALEEQLRGRRREPQPLTRTGQRLPHTRLVDRRLPQPRKLGLIDIETRDVEARLRRARGSHKTDVPHADHAEPITAHAVRPFSSTGHQRCTKSGCAARDREPPVISHGRPAARRSWRATSNASL